MARTAVTQLQQQIDEVRREGFAAGYAAAMQAIREVASRPARKNGVSTAAPSRRGRGPRATGSPSSAADSRSRSAWQRHPGKDPPLGCAQVPARGTNALIIEEILKGMAPSAVRPAEIRKALQDNGVTISFASISHALGQLEARNTAEKVDDSKTWRYRGSAT